MEGQGRSWKVIGGGVVACRIIVSAPVPVPFLLTLDLGFGTRIWDLNLGPGFGTWIWELDLGLDLGLTITDLENSSNPKHKPTDGSESLLQ